MFGRLTKIQTMKEMEMVGAELEVYEEPNESPKPHVLCMGESDPKDYVQKYVDSLSLSRPPYPIEVDVIVSDSQVTSSSTVSHSNTNATPSVDKNITNVKLQNSTMHTSQVCTS